MDLYPNNLSFNGGKNRRRDKLGLGTNRYFPNKPTLMEEIGFEKN
ncbi:MAG: hypothetical protein ACLTAI_01640 [Thomasclavelia sp.]